MRRFCPYCNKKIENAVHIYKCSSSNKLYSDRKADYIAYNYPEIATKELLEDLYINKLKSLPDIREISKADFKSILFLIEYFNINKRTASESVLKISKPKIEATNIKNFGSKHNFCKNTPSYHKRNQTVKDKYGVGNVFQLENHLEKARKSIIERYGITKEELNSKRSKEVWESKSDEERTKWYNDSIGQDFAASKVVGYTISKLESKVQEALNTLGITYTVQYLLKESTKKRYFYDFLLNDLNVIIEVQGEYWHASPKLYKGDDLVHYRFANVKAQDIWDKDKIKQDFAKSKNFIVIEVWEDELKNKFENGVVELIVDKLNNYGISKNKENN